jgi:hypothetical protein
MREELKLQEWVERIHDDKLIFKVFNYLILFFYFSFKSGINRDKPYPRMIVGEEPYIEPTKLERLSLREPNRQQWVTEKVFIFILFKRIIRVFLKGFRSLVHGIPEFDKFETTYVEPHFYYSS